MKYEVKAALQIVVIVSMITAVAVMSQIVIESNRNKNCICEEE